MPNPERIRARTINHTPGPWTYIEHAGSHFVYGPKPPEGDNLPLFTGARGGWRNHDEANARLIAAAPELLFEAMALRCLATSPRFQSMTVAEALAELAINGCGHDDGAAIAKAKGDKQ